LGKSSKDRNSGASSSARLINILLITGALVITAGIVWYTLKGADEVVPLATLPKPDVVTLDPAQFSGRAREAYQAAKEVPEVLAQLPCYCGCMSNFGHKNNLDCFHDEHGVECTTCQGIAIDARDMFKNGIKIERIRQVIKDRYGKYASLTP
jgi:hypothetical protein